MVTEAESDEDDKVEKPARAAKNASKAKGGRVKKAAPEKGIEEKTADNTEKPTRGRRKATMRKEAE